MIGHLALWNQCCTVGTAYKAAGALMIHVLLNAISTHGHSTAKLAFYTSPVDLAMNTFVVPAHECMPPAPAPRCCGRARSHGQTLCALAILAIETLHVVLYPVACRCIHFVFCIRIALRIFHKILLHCNSLGMDLIDEQLHQGILPIERRVMQRRFALQARSNINRCAVRDEISRDFFVTTDCRPHKRV